jgi:spore coat polysaccharide biosynthesis protein SpsF
MKFRTEQEAFWVGDFGDNYTRRNANPADISANIALFQRVLTRTSHVRSIIEFGANIGLNLRALSCLLPEVALEAVEINPSAAAALRQWGRCTVHETSILQYHVSKQFDLSFTKGVLIHINGDYLNSAYDMLHSSSRRYVMIAEYYNPTPVEVTYRGHSGKLFKRDFAGEFLDRFPDMALVDYGFVYHRDPNFPQDDCSWFLLEKVR